MSFRIGITIGDVVERDGDLLGDGVNIAARLQLARNLVRDRCRLADEHAVAVPADFERTCLVRC